MISTPSHVEEISFTCSLVINWYKNVACTYVVLACLKDHAFHIDTVYVNSINTIRGCTLQAELIVTTSSEATALQWESVLAGESPVSYGQLCNVYKGFASHINYLKLSCFLLYPLTVWRHIFTGCSQGGMVTFGNTLCTFKNLNISIGITRPENIYICVMYHSA